MRYKAVFLTGVGAGYVLGAKAGRRRYEQIMARARTILRRPEVERLTESARHEAGSLIESAKRVATQRFAGEDVTDRVAPPGTPNEVSFRL